MTPRWSSPQPSQSRSLSGAVTFAQVAGCAYCGDGCEVVRTDHGSWSTPTPSAPALDAQADPRAGRRAGTESRAPAVRPWPTAPLSAAPGLWGAGPGARVQRRRRRHRRPGRHPADDARSRRARADRPRRPDTGQSAARPPPPTRPHDGQAVQQHDRLPRPAPVPADKPNPVAHHHTLGPHHDRPHESSRPDHAPTATSRAQGRPSRRRAAMKHRPRPRRRCPATAAGQLPLSDPGDSITEVNAMRRPQLTSVAHEEEHSPCDCIA